MANYSTDPNQLGAWPANHMPNVAGVPWLFSTLPSIPNLSKGVTAYTLDLGTCVWNGTAWAQISNPDNTSPRNILTETDGASNAKIWDLFVDGGCFFGRTRTDADGAGKNWLAVTRSGTALTQIDLGNATDNPSYNFLGTGVTTFHNLIAVNTTYPGLQFQATGGGANTAKSSIYTSQYSVNWTLQSDNETDNRVIFQATRMTCAVRRSPALSSAPSRRSSPAIRRNRNGRSHCK